jgi:hypothetical protein
MFCEGNYFEREFQFVRSISDDIWAKKPSAQIVIYPHYFSGVKVPFANANGAKMAFDRRWTLFFTPHSAKVEPELMKQAAGSIWSSDGPAWCNVEKTRVDARYAIQAGCDGYIPSIECSTYVTSHVEDGQPWILGKRQIPSGFGWLKEGVCPYRELPMRVSRFAYREFSRQPELSMEAFRGALGKHLYGSDATPQAIEDALALTSAFNLDRTWSLPPALTSPGLLRARREQGKVSGERLAVYRDRLSQVSQIAVHYRTSRQPAMREMVRIAQWIVDRWSGANASLLAP